MYSIVTLFLKITHYYFIFEISDFSVILFISKSQIIPFVLIVTIYSIIILNITKMCHN